MKNKIKILVNILFLIPVIASGQTSSITGRIIDHSSNPVIGANILLQGTVFGTASDENGVFRIVHIPEGEFRLQISVIGYKHETIPVNLTAGQQLNLGTITLTDVALSSQPILVTASRYEQNLQDIPVSVGTVSRQEMQNRNTITIDKALQYVPGLSLNQSQLNIRGSTGYSRGVGSRVIMLVDGMPYLTGDTQEMIFNTLPVNQIERIEIVKGAGSALYGSSAIGGVVNIITKDIAEMQTDFKIYGGIYSKPYYPQWEWSKKSRFMNGLSIDHSAQSGILGYMLAVSMDQDDSYKQNDWFKRYQAGGKLRFTLSPYQRLVIGGNFMTQKRGDFLYWKDLSHALIPPAAQVDDRVESTRFHIDAGYQQVLDSHRFYSIKAIWFRNHFEDNIEGTTDQYQGNRSTSDFFNAEFQYNWQYQIHRWVVGLSGTYNRVHSNLFGNQSGQGAAAFVQDEIKWNTGLSTTLGMRFDYFDVESLKVEYRFNPKLGLVYKIGAGTALRSSVGSSFRAPSIAEAFTSTSAGGLKVVPNLYLKPERSWSYELGLNQFLGQQVYFDLAFFYTRIWDLIEGKFIESGDVQFINITDARIIGGELVINWDVIKNWLSWRSGYTYSDPWNLSQEKYLTYRPRHIFYNNATIWYHRIQLNIDYRFLSRYDQIDETFTLIIPDAGERVATHVVDLRLVVPFALGGMNLETSLQVNNLLQYNYVDLVGSIAPIRNFILTLASTF